jgi:hypothetical protein
MRAIISIIGVEEKRDKDNKLFYRTHALLDDGSEVIGYGSDYKVGDKVESFYHAQYDTHKMRKPIDKQQAL